MLATGGCARVPQRLMAEQKRHREDAKAKFCNILRDRGTVSAACEAIRVSRATAYAWRTKDETFAAAWQEAQEHVTDLIERTAVEMALEGYVETREVLDADGNAVELKARKMDPNMVRFLIGARRRSTYGDKREVEHKGDVTVKRVVFEREEGSSGE